MLNKSFVKYKSGTLRGDLHPELLSRGDIPCSAPREENINSRCYRNGSDLRPDFLIFFNSTNLTREEKSPNPHINLVTQCH